MLKLSNKKRRIIMNADNILRAIRTVYTDSYDNLTDNDKQFLHDKIKKSLEKAYDMGYEDGKMNVYKMFIITNGES